MMDQAVSDNFLRLVADSQRNGVPEMHFRLWRRATQDVRDKYVTRFRADPDAVAWYAEGYVGEDPDFDRLLTLPQDSLGYLYARHIVDNGLNKTIASDQLCPVGRALRRADRGPPSRVPSPEGRSLGRSARPRIARGGIVCKRSRTLSCFGQARIDLDQLNAHGALIVSGETIAVSYSLKLGKVSLKGDPDLSGTVNAPKLESKLLRAGPNRGELRLEGGMVLDVILTPRSLDTALVVVVDKSA